MPVLHRFREDEDKAPKACATSWWPHLPKRLVEWPGVGDLQVPPPALPFTDPFDALAARLQSQHGRSAHPLRHTAAHTLVDRGVDLRVVQEIMGHARLSTTSVYLKRKAVLGELAEALERRPAPDAA